MNIDEYRAMMKSQAEENSDAQTQPPADANVPAEQTKVEAPPSESAEETKPTGDGKATDTSQETVAVDGAPSLTIPETIEIEGVAYTVDELKNGYMRQSDYTKKTQEAKREMRAAKQAIEFMEKIKSNPELATELSTKVDIPDLDPRQAQYSDLEEKYYDLLIQTEMQKLHAEHGDFDEREILQIAQTEGVQSLDAAFHIAQGRKSKDAPNQKQELDVETLKEQLRKELLAELETKNAANADTSTIIQSAGSAPVGDTSPKLSRAELKVASNMGMTPKDYAEWRDFDKKKK